MRIDNGRPVWNETLIGARGDIRAFGNLTDIRGRPVIDRGLVLAMGSAGQIAAVDLRSGQRQWDRNIGGSQTPWVAGRFVFVLTSTADVAAILRDSGVPSGRVVAFGRGEDVPVASNLTPEGRAKNRRVEIIIRPTR